MNFELTDEQQDFVSAIRDFCARATSVERANGGFVLNGQKVFCSNAHISDRVLLAHAPRRVIPNSRGHQ